LGSDRALQKVVLDLRAESLTEAARVGRPKVWASESWASRLLGVTY
jgi:hypothetical protein